MRAPLFLPKVDGSVAQPQKVNLRIVRQPALGQREEQVPPEAEPVHTVNYDPFIKSQLAFTQLALGPSVIRIWSRHPLRLGGDETRAVYCAAGETGQHPRGSTSTHLFVAYSGYIVYRQII